LSSAGRTPPTTTRPGTTPADALPRCSDEVLADEVDAQPAGAKSILAMAAPLVVSFGMRQAFTLVDTIYASTLGDAAVAAIALTIPYEFLMIACWVGVSNGLTSILSQAMGARQGARIEQALSTTRRIVWALVPLFLAAAAGIALGARHMKIEPEVARQFAIYGAVLVGGSAFTAFWSILPDSIVKAHHDTRSTMWAGIWSNMINVGLNTVFTFVFHWGIFGIAFSTVVGRVGGLVYALRKSAAHEKARLATGRDGGAWVDPAPLRAILVLAVPAALTYALMALETFMVNWLLTRHADSTPSVAAYGIYYRVMMFAVMPIIATSTAMLPFAARRFGAGDLRGIRRGIRQAFLAAVGYSILLVAPVVLVAGPYIARWLARSPMTETLTQTALNFAPLACLASIPFLLCRPAFEGLQRGGPGLVMALLRYVVLTIPCAFGGIVTADRLGLPVLYGLLGGLIVASGIASTVFLVWMRRTLASLERPAAPGGPSLPVPAPAVR
jgi:Na+-driven multidrug efflux pump